MDGSQLRGLALLLKVSSVRKPQGPLMQPSHCHPCQCRLAQGTQKLCDLKGKPWLPRTNLLLRTAITCLGSSLPSHTA
jgi:hypothetical protein